MATRTLKSKIPIRFLDKPLHLAVGQPRCNVVSKDAPNGAATAQPRAKRSDERRAAPPWVTAKRPKLPCRGIPGICHCVREDAWRLSGGCNRGGGGQQKRWIEEKLKQLAENFGIALLAFSCLSNHFHLLLRSRPDIVATWDDTQVALRWWQLCPTRKVKLEVDGQWVKVPAEPTEFPWDVDQGCCYRCGLFWGGITVRSPVPHWFIH